MTCPTCGSETAVIDSRHTESRGIRRRRKCTNGHRFTTYERAGDWKGLATAAPGLDSVPVPTDRQAEAYCLRYDDGLYYREIGERMGVTGQRAHQLVAAAEKVLHADETPEHGETAA